MRYRGRPGARMMPGPRPAGPALARLARTRSAHGDVALLLGGVHSRRLVLLKSLLTRLERHPGAAPAPARRRFEEHWRLLEQAESLHPHSVRRTLDYPAVGHWLARTLAAADGEQLGGLLERFGAVAASAALRAGTDFTLELPAPDGLLALPGIGLLGCDTPTVRLTARGPAAHLAPGPVLHRAAGRVHGSGTGWRGLRPLPGSAGYLDDLDPHRAPPGGVGHAALPASPRSATAVQPWLSRWRAALALLRFADPLRAAETTALLRCLVPLAGGDAGQVSATLRAAPGAVLCTLPDTAEDLAEVLVHETQHGKLAVLHDLVPLHHAGPHAVHRVPWRPDPRPFEGVLQGTYAHLALADFWTRAARRDGLAPTVRSVAVARGDACRRQVAQALPLLLESRELTPAGREFAACMQQHLVCLGRSVGPFPTVCGTSPSSDVR
ncbi:aKG-HExxH-type peptide beta-hydroxylase [Streptoverticillium reticulum]|uniref:aKG-HExxH-type peptide beta-hydroxylase n=1 Tax=Streptoverticillium reticulum TaxID=1433415 RepID=UPI0039BF5341